MIKLYSKTGTANAKQEVVFNFLNDFKNFADLLPTDRLQNIKITGDTLEFSIGGMGNVGLRMSERHHFTQLVIKAMDGSMADFIIWINLGALTEHTTQVNLTLQANLNMFLELMAKEPLQQFINVIVDKLSALKFQ